jgi:hypothetical protein
MGNGGSPGVPGGGGGGAILVASNTKIVINGAISAYGATTYNGGDLWGGLSIGSGGAVRVVAPTVSGSGSLAARNLSYANGPGRIRIDCQDHQSYRTLSLAGLASRGSRMIVFPTNAPQLDIVEVAGNPIPEGTNSSVLFELPSGASSNQSVKVQARNFSNNVPIRVVVTPENGPCGEFDAIILQASGNPPSTNVTVIIPAGSVCQIHAWTR